MKIIFARDRFRVVNFDHRMMLLYSTTFSTKMLSLKTKEPDITSSKSL